MNKIAFSHEATSIYPGPSLQVVCAAFIYDTQGFINIYDSKKHF